MNRSVPLARAALAALAILLAVPLGVPADDPKPAPGPGGVRRVGVFIGVQKYASDRIPKLRAPEQDAKRMEQVLTAACGLSRTYLLTNEQATLAAITDVFTKKLLADTDPKDEIIVYWSGHGLHLPEANPNADPPARLFLIPHDGDPSTVAAVNQTMVKDTTFFRDWLLKLEDRRVLLILDTCHSGGAVKARAGGPQVVVKAVQPPVPGVRAAAVPLNFPKHFLDGATRGVRSTGRTWVLASSQADQPSFELPKGDHGVMTYFLLDALATEKKGKTLSVAEAAEFLKEKVPAFCAANAYPAVQNPVFDGPSQPVPLIRHQ